MGLLALVPPVPGLPNIVFDLVIGFLDRMTEDIRRSIWELVGTLVLSTYDFSTGHLQPLTANGAIQRMHHLTVAMADLLLVLVFLWAFFRSQWEFRFRAHYTLKMVLPRAMAAIALAHFSLLFGQMAIDLNNALVHAAVTADLSPQPLRFPWEIALASPFGSPGFWLLVRLAIVVMVVMLALTYVLRFALLAVLLVLAPLAALCMILPETKRYARAWSQLFLTTVFMQFAQVLILRFAGVFMTEEHNNPIQALYGLVVLYLVLKVPGLMHASSHLETKLEHLALRTAKHAIAGRGHHPRARTAEAV